LIELFGNVDAAQFLNRGKLAAFDRP
jgi:hypothetical protein